MVYLVGEADQTPLVPLSLQDLGEPPVAPDRDQVKQSPSSVSRGHLRLNSVTLLSVREMSPR